MKHLSFHVRKIQELKHCLITSLPCNCTIYRYINDAKLSNTNGVNKTNNSLLVSDRLTPHVKCKKKRKHVFCFLKCALRIYKKP